MSIKRVFKKIVSLTPKWLFNFFISFTTNKKMECDEVSLESFNPDNGHSSLEVVRVIQKTKYDLKIIIPCYNVEKYIDECVKSILNQKTKYDFVVVLVNDGSTDNTLNLIERFTSDKVLIIDKPNGGSASARNKALEIVESEFVMFVDSDDCFLGDTVLDLCLDMAYKAKSENVRNIIVEFRHSNLLTLSKNSYGLSKVEYTQLSGFSWAKVFSTDLFIKAGFPEGYWFEDTVLSTIIYPQADACFLNKTKIYFYRPTENSMTIKGKESKKAIDTFYVTKKLLSDRKQLGLPKDYNFDYRFYMQVICNSVRLKTLPEEIQVKVFFETVKLFDGYSIKSIKRFKQLYKSLSTKNYKRFSKFCLLYSKMYLNV